MPGKAFYKSSAWKTLRRIVLVRDRGRCVECGKSVSGRNAHVDHIRRLEERPDLALDPNNLQLLCAGCHNRKAARIDGRFGGAPRPVMGACDAEGEAVQPGHPWFEEDPVEKPDR